jgi:predicted CoA-binding protein
VWRRQSIADEDMSGVTPEYHLTPDERRRILESFRGIAVVGLSDNRWKPSYGVAEYLQEAGYQIIPVNPNHAGKSILGEEVYASLAGIPKPVDIVNVFRRAEFTPEVARQAVANGAKVLWLQLGIVNEEAARIARESGLTVVMDRCLATEHERFFSE